MKRNLRRTLTPFLEVLAVVVVLVDVGLAVGVFWFSGRLDAVRDLRQSVRAQVALEQIQVARLEKSRAMLPDAEGQMKLFLQDHVPSRREGYARAIHLVQSLAQKSGVQLDGVGYKLQQAHDEPLQHMTLEVGLVGPFAKLIDFAHSLETAGEFVVARSFHFAPGEGGKLTLHLSADFYMTP